MTDRLTRYLLPLLVFLTPLFFWTLTPNFFATPKLLLLVSASLLLIVVYCLEIALTRSMSYPPKLLLPLALFGIVLIVNLLIFTPGRTEALYNRGALYLSCLVLAYFAHLSGSRLLKPLSLAFYSSSLVLALHSLFQLTYLHTLTSLPDVMQSQAFTLTGSPLTTLTLLTLACLSSLLQLLRTPSSPRRIFYLAVSALTLLSGASYLSLMLPGRTLAPALLTYGESWSVALDAVKNFKQLILGTGLGDFVGHYTSVKPLSVNLGPLWSTNPAGSTSELLHLLTTTGLLGFGSFLVLLVSAFKTARAPLLHLAGLALILTPVSPPLALVFFVFLAVSHPHASSRLALSTPSLALALTAFGLCLTSLISYFVGRAILAELSLGQALNSLAAGNAQAGYTELLRSVQLVPTFGSYRLSYSQLNLRLASSLSQKSELTAKERESIAQLVSQAVREARAAVALNPRDAAAWTNLGLVYRNLINVAEGAEDFALESLSRAVALDPGNPALRVDFGGLSYQLALAESDPAAKDLYLSRSRDEFALAAKLKPDYASAYYNLAKTLQLQEDYPGAYAAMQSVVRYLDPAAPDYSSILDELESLRSQLPIPAGPDLDETAPIDSTLSEPSPLPSPLPGGPLDLPAQTSLEPVQ